jgi:hypothetical protein
MKEKNYEVPTVIIRTLNAASSRNISSLTKFFKDHLSEAS